MKCHNWRVWMLITALIVSRCRGLRSRRRGRSRGHTGAPHAIRHQGQGHWHQYALRKGRARARARALHARAPQGWLQGALCVGVPMPVCQSQLMPPSLPPSSQVPLSAADKKKIVASVAEMAARPLRCLAMAIREDVGDLADYDGPSHPAHEKLKDPSTFINLEQNLVFVGICGIKDPARPEVAPAIKECVTAGIRVVMITGDTQVRFCTRMPITPQSVVDHVRPSTLA